MSSLGSRSLSTNSAGKLQVLRHYSHSLGVDCAKVGILKETDKVCLGCFLECQYGLALESKVALVLLSDLSDEPLEGKLTNEKLSLKK